MKPLCIYHGKCDDGFGAALACWKRHGGDYEYYPADYGDGLPETELDDRDIVIVDFSYPREDMEELAELAASVTVLDHHKTARDDLQPLLDSGTVRGEFDMERSGAMMAWQHFHPHMAVPDLIRFIQDRDLWLFELDATRFVSAALRSYPQEFALWDSFIGQEHRLVEEGRHIDRWYQRQVRELAANPAYTVIGGYRVPVVNCPKLFASDVAGMLAAGQPFAACYYDLPGDPPRREFSLRARGPDALDVGAIAKEYGGGGHRNAAGFRAEIAKPAKLVA